MQNDTNIGGVASAAAGCSEAAEARKRQLSYPFFDLAFEQLESAKAELRNRGEHDVVKTIEWAEGTLSDGLDELASSAGAQPAEVRGEMAGRGERAAHSEADSLLRWSAEKPQREGWWWVEMPGRETLPGQVGIAVRRVVRQRAFGNKLCVHGGTIGWAAMDDPCLEGWRWAGPLTEPQDASPAMSAKPPPND